MNEDYSRSPSIHKYTPVIGWIIKNGNSCLTGGSGECVSERMNEWRWDERAKKKINVKWLKRSLRIWFLSAIFMDGDILDIKSQEILHEASYFFQTWFLTADDFYGPKIKRTTTPWEKSRVANAKKSSSESTEIDI